MKQLLTFFIFLITYSSYAQNSNVSWSFDSKKTGTDEYTIHLKATIQPGWYVYSQYLESDDGPIRTAVVLEENTSISLDGKATEEGSKMDGYDDMFGMNIIKYKKELVITQKIKTTTPTTIKGYVTFMTCNDEMCLPPTDVPFELKLK